MYNHLLSCVLAPDRDKDTEPSVLVCPFPSCSLSILVSGRLEAQWRPSSAHLIHRSSLPSLGIQNRLCNAIWLAVVPFPSKLALQTRPALLVFLIYSRHHPHRPFPTLSYLEPVTIPSDPLLLI